MFKYCVCSLIMAACFSGSLTEEEYQENSTALEPLSVEQKWEEMERELQSGISEGIKTVLPLIMKEMGTMNISSDCTGQMLKLIAGARKMKPWAMRIFGANSGVLTGISFETLSAMGAYDQCIDSEVIYGSGKKKGEIMFRGKYCIIDVRPPLPSRKPFYIGLESPEELRNFSNRDTVLGEAAKYANLFHAYSYHAGLCVPSGCSESDVSQMAKSVFESKSMISHIKRCELKEENEFTPLIIGILFTYSLISFLVLMASLVDQFFSNSPKHNGLLLKMLLSFSIKKNFKRLFYTPVSSGDLTCLNGIRVVSITWIILGHAYYLIPKDTIRGIKFFGEASANISFTFAYRGHLAVESFFFISGMLSCYARVKYMKDFNKPRDLCLYILRRIWRLLPPLLFVMSFVFLFNLIGSGPIWHNVTHDVIRGCYDNWWTNLLFIGNFHYVNSNTCLPHTWYVSCDTQLYIFALIVLIPLARNPKCGVMISVGTIVTSMVVTAAITLANGFPPAITVASPDMESMASYLKQVYVKPYTHAASYSTGILAGYVLIVKPKLKFSKIVQVLGWCIFLVFTSSVYFGVWKWNRGVRPTLLETLFFSSCSNVAWSLALGWMVICCATGQGGLINTILSWNLWVPLGRLTYVAYLVHPIIQYPFIGVSRTERSFYQVVNIWEFFGHLLATYGVSIVVNLMIESPFSALEKVFLFKGEKKKSPPARENDGCTLEKGGKCNEDDLTISPQEESFRPEGLDNPVFVQRL